MRRTWLLLAALLLCLAGSSAWSAATVPVLHQHVTDQTGTLTPAQVAQLEARLVALEQKKGSQVAVLMVATTGDQSLEGYSLAVAEAAQLGRAKTDDGLLLLVAKDDRKARIEVGYGLEGVVTDALSSRVIREYLAPKFRANDYFGGISDAVGVLSTLVEGEPLPAPMVAEPGASGSPNLMLAAFVGFFIGMLASGTRLKPVLLRRLGAGGIAAGIAWFVLAAGFTSIVAALVAFLVSSAGGGRFGSGRGHWGSFPAGGGGWGGSSGGGGGWSGGGGSFGGGGASGGW